MSSPLSYDARASLSHRARRDRLRKALDLAIQLEEALRDVEPRYAIQSGDVNIADFEQAVLEDVYSLEHTTQRQLQAVNEQRNEAFSPTSRLTDDALQLIFSYVCMHTDLYPLSPWRSNNIVLSHVCRRWRTVALNLAPLWAEIKFYVHQPRLHVGDRDPWVTGNFKSLGLSSARKLDAFLERARDSPLKTGLNLLRCQEFDGAVTNRFLSECSGRTEFMSIILPTNGAASMVFCIASTNLILKQLSVHFLRDTDTIPMDELTRMFYLPMPNLHDLTLRSMPTPSIFVPEFIAFNNVKRMECTELSGDFFTTQTFSVLLQCCPNLESLVLYGNAGRSPQQMDATPFHDRVVQPISMTRLKSYVVRFEPILFPIAFHVLVAPALTSLSFRLTSIRHHPTADAASQASMDVCTDAICSFLQKSSPALQVISMSGVFTPNHERILRLTPTIKNLTLMRSLSIPPDDENVEPSWKALIPSLTSEVNEAGNANDLLCPDLENIVYHGAYGERLLRILLQLIHERSQPQPPFLHVLPIRSLELTNLVTQSDEGRTLEAQIGDTVEEFCIQNWRASIAHRARRESLRKAVDLATQLDDTLRNMERRYSIRSDRAKDEVDQEVLNEVYVLEEALEEKLRAVSEQRNEVMSPTSRLNDDALQLIFRHVCSVTGVDMDALSPYMAGNIVISHVCRRWRALSLKTVTLWTQAKFAAEPLYRPFNRHPWATGETEAPILSNMERLDTFLERSKDSALSVSLDLTREASFVLGRFLDECRGRAEFMSVLFLMNDEKTLLGCLSSVNLVLKSLYIHPVSATGPGDGQSLPMNVVEDVLRLPMPSLLHLTLRTIPAPSSFDSSYIGLSGVVRLELTEIPTDFTASMLTTLLRCCSVLETLSLLGQQISFQWNNQPEEVPLRDMTIPRVSMPTLKSYTVHLDSRLLPAAFDVLLAPQLIDLDFSLHGGMGDPTFEPTMDVCTDAITLFLAKSSPHLRSLGVDGMLPRYQERILRSTPTITDLIYSHWIHMAIENDDLAGQLSGLMPSRCNDWNDLLCPSLQNITYHGSYGDPLLSMCLQIVLERSHPPLPFSHFTPIRSLELSSLVTQSDEGRKLEAQIGAAIEEFVIESWRYDKNKGEWLKRSTNDYISSRLRRVWH